MRFELTRTDPTDHGVVYVEPVIAVVQRPGDYRIETLTGATLAFGHNKPTNYLTGTRKPWLLAPELVQPVYDQTGLVLRRPEANYAVPARGLTDHHARQFAGALDPSEMAGNAPVPLEFELNQLVRFEVVQPVSHHGRPAWQALAVPGPHYARSGGSLLQPGPQLVRLDVETAVCVAISPVLDVSAQRIADAESVEGSVLEGMKIVPEYWVLDLRILAVDEYVAEELFTSERPSLTNVAGDHVWVPGHSNGVVNAR